MFLVLFNHLCSQSSYFNGILSSSDKSSCLVEALALTAHCISIGQNPRVILKRS